MTARKIIALDCETTGLYPERGDRIIEIGAVEIRQDKTLGATFHTYINPERSIPKEATSVHGIDDNCVKSAPKFKDIMYPLMDFIRGSLIIMHNAPFDHKFLLSEFGIYAFTDKELVDEYLLKTVQKDTLDKAKRLFPGSSNSLTSLAERFSIQDDRVYHGALQDACLLAKVSMKMRKYIQLKREYIRLSQKIPYPDKIKEKK